MNLQLKQILFNKVAELKEEIINFERDLVRIPSENPPGNYEKISEAVANKLNDVGFKVSITRDRPDKPNVIGNLKGTAGKPILIHNAHLDTVPVGTGWSVDPFEAVMKDGKIFGRGAYDAKARIVTYIMSAKLIQEAGYRLKGNLVDFFSVDEESGGGTDGTGYCLDKGYLTGDVTISEGRQDEIWFAESGHAIFKIDVFGKTSHAMYPSLGISAIDKMTDVLIGLRRLQKELKKVNSNIPGLDYSTINIGTIHGGERNNVLAGMCSIVVDVRVIPEVNIDEVIEKVMGIVSELKEKDAKFNAKVDLVFKSEPNITPDNLPIIKIIRDASMMVLGSEPKVIGLHADSDCKYFRKAGIPAVHWGVGTSKNRGHAADEFIEIDDLINLTVAHALVVMEYLGYDKKEK